MSFVFVDGFDYYLNSEMTARGWSANTNQQTAGTYDGLAMRMATNATAPRHALPSNYSTAIMGLDFRTNTIGTADFAALMTGTTLTCRIGLTAGGPIRILNSGGSVIATGTTNITTNTWNFFEVKCFINGASGTVEVHLNGATEIASTVGNFGASNIDTVGLIGSGSATFDWDNLWVLETSTSPNNNFLGVTRVETVYPNATGNYSQFTPNGATPNFACVDENPPDGDATYVSSNTPGNLDSYLHGTIDGASTLYGVQTNHYARKDDANTRQIAPLIRQAGTDYVGTTVSLGATYQFYEQIYNQDPTNTNWTPAVFNGDEFGIKEIA